ncbi:MAG: hypothetical protein K0R26_1950 [Bacteroidota bacterium]|jgi:hypothetical protein|nr:hypothetical protein [Bacteroidota bacterium]
MTEIETKFYAHLGLLSNQFARMEQMIMLMCSGLMGGNQYSSRLVMEKNILTKNLKLLSTLSKENKFEEAEIASLIKEIHLLKADRNRFIHSVW